MFVMDSGTVKPANKKRIANTTQDPIILIERRNSYFGGLPDLPGKKHPGGFVASCLARTLWLPYRKIWLSWLKSSRIYSLWRPGKEGWNCFFFFGSSLRNGWISVDFFWVFQDCHADSCFSNRGILEGWFSMIIWSSFWLLKIPIGKVSPMMASGVGEVVDRNGNRQLSQLLRRVQTFLRHFNFVQLLGASIDCKELHRFCFFWQQKAENCDQLWSTIFTTDLRPKCFPDNIFSQVLVMNQALQIHHLLALTTTSCSFHLAFLEQWWLEFLKENKLRNVLWVAKSSCFKQLKVFPDFNVSRSFCLTTFQARFDAASIAAATATATRSGLPAEN